MPKTVISALTSLLHNQSQFVIADALNSHQCAAAVIPHSHNCWELLIFQDGKVQFNPPKTIHDSPKNVAFAIETDMLKISCRDCLNSQFHRWKVPGDQPHFAPELLVMLQRVYPAQPISGELFSGIIASLIHVMKNLSRQQEEKTSQNAVEHLEHFLHTHYRQPELSLESIAELFNMSPQYMNRILRKHGFPPLHTLLKDIRLKKAKELLDSGNYRIKDAARLAGWRSADYFRSCFVQKFNMTPQAYLNKNRTGNSKQK